MRLLLLGFTLMLAGICGAASVAAAPAEDAPSKVDICHATASATHPYELLTVGPPGLDGHDAHDGDLVPAPESGCPSDVATCDDAGLPCQQIPFLPAAWIGVLGLVIGATLAGAFVMHRGHSSRHG